MHTVRTVLSICDHARIRRFLADCEAWLDHEREQLSRLRKRFDSAVIVEPEALPEGVATLHSQVRVRNVESGRTFVSTVALPSSVQMACRPSSPLFGLGAVLLGRHEGDELISPEPAHGHALRIEKVLFQPEAADRAAFMRARNRRAAGRTTHGDRPRELTTIDVSEPVRLPVPPAAARQRAGNA